MEDERVGNQQRNQVLELLNAALEQGYVTLEEYEQRMTAVSAAQTVSVLQSQVTDLPAQFRWNPRSTTQQTGAGLGGQPPTEEKARTFAITSLVFGIASILLSVCLVGWLFGIAAIFFSVRGGKGDSSWSKAFAGRVLGIVGIILQLGVVVLLIIGSLNKHAS